MSHVSEEQVAAAMRQADLADARARQAKAHVQLLVQQRLEAELTANADHAKQFDAQARETELAEARAKEVAASAAASEAALTLAKSEVARAEQQRLADEESTFAKSGLNIGRAVLGLGAFGLLLGLLTGLSSSPVVGTMVTGLLGLGATLPALIGQIRGERLRLPRSMVELGMAGLIGLSLGFIPGLFGGVVAKMNPEAFRVYAGKAPTDSPLIALQLPEQGEPSGLDPVLVSGWSPDELSAVRTYIDAQAWDSAAVTLERLLLKRGAKPASITKRNGETDQDHVIRLLLAGLEEG